jgi:PAS domain S-box-containing protein
MKFLDRISRALGRMRLWQQFVLLGLFVIVVPITWTSYQFLSDGKRILTEHEIIDLSDESNLRANEMREEFDYLVGDVRFAARELRGKTADKFANDAADALQRFTQSRPLDMPDPGKRSETPAQVRRRFYADTLVESHAVAIARRGADGPVQTVTSVVAISAIGQTIPEEGMQKNDVITALIKEVSDRMCRENPRQASYISAFHLQPPTESRGAQCLFAVGYPARYDNSHVSHALVAIFNFTKVVENRRGISPRHQYIVAQANGALLIHPNPMLARDGVQVPDIVPWKFPALSWADPTETSKDRGLRLAQMVQEGGARLKSVPITQLASFYRKGFFGDEIGDKLGERTSAELQAINKHLADLAKLDPSLRYGELGDRSGYSEVSHPDRAKLLEVCGKIDAWWKEATASRRAAIDWIEPLECKTFQGQITYLRMDTSDEDEPPRLLVAASTEELSEDIDTRFTRIVYNWVIPTVALAVGLAVGLIVVITHSVGRLARAANQLTDPSATPVIEGGGSHEVTQLAVALQAMVGRLQDNATRFQTILRSAGEGIVVAGIDAKIEEANRAAAKMFGFEKPEELVGKAIQDLLVEPLSQLTTTDGPTVQKITDAVKGRRADMTEFWIEYTLRPVLLKDRTLFAGVFRDVSGKREAEEQIHQLNEDLETRVKLRTAELAEANTKLEVALRQAETASRAKDAFVANMSHELRQPLHIIIGFTEAMRDEANDDGRLEIIPDLNKILSAARHLLDLINDILDLAKIAAGKLELSIARFDLPKMIDDVRNLVAPLAEKHKNEFLVDAPTDLGTMTADERRVRQILINLLSNAFKFTADGTVTLQVRRVTSSNQAMIEFSVADTGKGMTTEQVQRLFQRFYQADNSTTREQGGTGLGLAITQSFNELMGGEPIHVSSLPGSGSHFVIRLPAVVVPIQEHKLPARPTPTELMEALPPLAPLNRVDGMTILVIDDDPMVPELMRRFLAKDGFNVVSSTDGDQGLILAREMHPSAITLDVMMPGLDGWNVLAKLKADPSTCDIPVVMLTIVDDRGRGYALGAADYLTKPIDWPRLNVILRRYQTAGRESPILVIDDDPECREMLRRFLERDDRRVTEAPDGEAGLRAIAGEIPSLILLDLMMPVLDGFGFLTELPRRFPGANIPVLVLTAKDLTAEDHARLNGRVARILEKGDLTQFEPLAELIRTITPHALPEVQDAENPDRG